VKVGALPLLAMYIDVSIVILDGAPDDKARPGRSRFCPSLFLCRRARRCASCPARDPFPRVRHGENHVIPSRIWSYPCRGTVQVLIARRQSRQPHRRLGMGLRTALETRLDQCLCRRVDGGAHDAEAGPVSRSVLIRIRGGPQQKPLELRCVAASMIRVLRLTTLQVWTPLPGQGQHILDDGGRPDAAFQDLLRMVPGGAGFVDLADRAVPA